MFGGIRAWGSQVKEQWQQGNENPESELFCHYGIHRSQTIADKAVPGLTAMGFDVTILCYTCISRWWTILRCAAFLSR